MTAAQDRREEIAEIASLPLDERAARLTALALLLEKELEAQEGNEAQAEPNGIR